MRIFNIVKLPIFRSINSHNLPSMMINGKLYDVKILEFIDSKTMVIKIGNMYFGAKQTYSTNINNVIPFTKIIYLEHANYDGIYDPNKNFNTISGLNYYHYKQTDPNDYSLQSIMVRDDKITEQDYVCFFLSPGIWKARSPKMVSSKWTSWDNRSNGFYMWNMVSSMFGYGIEQTIIDMNFDTYTVGDASTLHLPSDANTTVNNNIVSHFYGFVNFKFSGSGNTYLSSGIGQIRTTNNAYSELDDSLLCYECKIDWTNYTAQGYDIYANGGTFKFYNTSLNGFVLKNYLYRNRDTKFVNIKTNNVFYVDISGSYDTSSIFNGINGSITITDITKV
jgi:hypothetical protein